MDCALAAVASRDIDIHAPIQAGQGMSVWFAIVAALLLLAAALIRLGKLPRQLWTFLAAFSMLGMAGYAYQGSPELPTSKAKQESEDNGSAVQLLKIREEMTATFAGSKKWTVVADRFARQGKYSLAMALVGSGLKERPENGDLWAAMGVYAMLANDGRIGAPSELAFARARQYYPNLAVPDYFEGLDALADRRLLDTFKKWDAALSKAPKDSKWEPKLRRQFSALLSAVKQAETERQRLESTGGADGK